VPGIFVDRVVKGIFKEKIKVFIQKLFAKANFSKNLFQEFSTKLTKESF